MASFHTQLDAVTLAYYCLQEKPIYITAEAQAGESKVWTLDFFLSPTFDVNSSIYLMSLCCKCREMYIDL